MLFLSLHTYNGLIPDPIQHAIRLCIANRIMRGHMDLALRLAAWLCAMCQRRS